MIEVWRAKQNCENKIGTQIMLLSKVFDTINQDLVLFIWKGYGFKENSVSSIRSYFTNR